MTRLLGIDLGERRIGVAIGDDGEGGFARQLVTVRRGSPQADARRIAQLCAEQGAVGLVIGLPLRLDGSEGPQAEATRAWAAAIADHVHLPIAWRDERLTSVAAEATVGRMSRASSGGPPTGRTRERHRAAVDREAARSILQAELDARGAQRARAAQPPAPATGAHR